jgi:hypothetical protein
MTTWVKPSPSTLQTAFNDHGVNWVKHSKCVNGRSQWSQGLRAATVHHTAGKNSADYLATEWSYPGANCVINNGNYNGWDKDGRAVILCWGDCWHSGDGGPWSGIAGKDALHYVSWGIEIESLGTKKDITAEQKETVGRMLAALVEVGMPVGNIHRHEDWTDGSGPVGGYPLSTNGRKIDTADDLGYTTKLWVDLAKQYGKGKYWDGVYPSGEGSQNASDDPNLKNPQAWRWACRMADLGWFSGAPQPKGVQGWPRKAVENFQKARGYGVTGDYGPKLYEMIFGIPAP